MEDQPSQATQVNAGTDNNPEFNITRLYIKDLSYEAPHVPLQFLEKEYSPKIDLELSSYSQGLNEDTHEVVLRVLVTAKQNEKTVFLLEIQYGGVFTLRRFPENQLKHMLGSFCPNILFPYVRGLVDDLVTRGGFPALYLAPVNFDALYAQYLQRMEQEAQAKQTEH